MYLFNRPKDIGNVRLLSLLSGARQTLFQIIYGVNVTGLKHEIVGARVLTIHWFIAFPDVGNNKAAYIAYRDRLNEFWDQKTQESNIKFIPHKSVLSDF